MTQGDLFPSDGPGTAPDGSESLRRRCLGPTCGRDFLVNPHAGEEHRFCSDPCRKAWHKKEEGRGPTRAERILERLRVGPATGLDLLRAGGGTRYGARILELRRAGHQIETDTSEEWPVYRLTV